MNVLVVGLEGVGVRSVAESLDDIGPDTAVRILELTQRQVASPSARLSVGKLVPDLIVLVTDSTQQNVTKSRDLVKILNKQFRGVEKIAIANRPNQPGLLNVEEIGAVLGLTTYERPTS